MASNENRLRKRYFAPGQLLIVAEHSRALRFDRLFGQLREVMEQFEERYEGEEITTILDYDFVPLNGSGRIERREPHDEQLRFFSYLPIWLQDDDDEALIDIVNTFYLNKEDINGIGAELGIKIESIMPNWFATPAQSGTATGGPGSIPMRVVPPCNSDWHEFVVLGCDHDEQSTTNLNRLGNALERRWDSKCPANVVILDAFPDQTVCKNAFDKWSTHPILNTLKDQFHEIDEVQLMREIDWNCNDEGIVIEKHCYKMPDHGIFVAGIIHTIAPNAEIYPIRVLNEFGVGTIGSVAQGLKMALDLRRRKSASAVVVEDCPEEVFLINMSLTITLPRHERHITPDLLNKDTNSSEQQLAEQVRGMLNLPDDPEGEKTNPTIDSMLKLYDWLHDELANGNNKQFMVAAAGNDWDGNNDIRTRPIARFPAALQDVIGVGAFGKISQVGIAPLARYTNESDWLVDQGIAAFGGTAQPGQIGNFLEPDSRDGMLGVYTSDTFPVRGGPDSACKGGEPNGYGWALWSGTSFAAPVVTGMLALLCQQTGMSLDAAISTIRDAVEEYMLNQQGEVMEDQLVEDILPIQQKPAPQQKS